MTPDRFTRRGEDAPNARFTQAQAREYRRRFHQERPRPTIRQLAEEAQVPWSTMRDAVKGITYQDNA
jgi:hypothetical protein